MLAENKYYFHFQGNYPQSFDPLLRISPVSSIKPSSIKDRLQFTLNNTFYVNRYCPLDEGDTNSNRLIQSLDEALESDEKRLDKPVYVKIRHLDNKIIGVYRKVQKLSASSNLWGEVSTYRPVHLDNVNLMCIMVDSRNVVLHSIFNEKDQIKVRLVPERDQVNMKFYLYDEDGSVKTLLTVEQMVGEWLLDMNCIYPVVNNQVQDPVKLRTQCIIDEGFIT